jgi:hypothetical protein
MSGPFLTFALGYSLPTLIFAGAIAVSGETVPVAFGVQLLAAGVMIAALFIQAMRRSS